MILICYLRGLRGAVNSYILVHIYYWWNTISKVNLCEDVSIKRMKEKTPTDRSGCHQKKKSLEKAEADGDEVTDWERINRFAAAPAALLSQTPVAPFSHFSPPSLIVFYNINFLILDVSLSLRPNVRHLYIIFSLYATAARPWR